MKNQENIIPATKPVGMVEYFFTDSSVSEAGVFHYAERVAFPSEDKTLRDEVRFITESFDFDEKIMDYRLSDRKKERLKWKDFSLQNLSDNLF